MQVAGNYKILESIATAMDPALDGFAGVLVELVFDGEQYMLCETRWAPVIASYAYTI